MISVSSPIKVIKGQALANFIVECTHLPPIKEAHDKEWMLFVNRASSAKGCGGRDSIDFLRKGDLGVLPSVHLSQFKQCGRI